MRVRYSPRAINDLVAIADYLMERNPSVAKATEARILATVDLLSEFTASGRALEKRPNVV